MKRAKLIRKVSSRLNLNEIETGNFIGSIFDTMLSVFKSGKNLNIPEFGKFIVRNKTVNGEVVKYISFSPCKKFADEINSNFSELSPVLTKALNFQDLSEIRVTEADDDTDESNFVYFTFDDDTDNVVIVSSEIETVIDGEPLTQPGDFVEEQTGYDEFPSDDITADTIIADEEILPSLDTSETVTEEVEIPAPLDTIDTLVADTDVTEKPYLPEIPCLIPFNYRSDGFTDTEEIKKTDTETKPQDICSERKIADVPLLIPVFNGITSTVEPADKKTTIVRDENLHDDHKISEPVITAPPKIFGILETEQPEEKQELIEPESVSEESVSAETDGSGDGLQQTENTVSESVIEETVTVKNEYETIEEKIVREKEIILKDIEEYVKSKDAEKTTDAFKEPEHYFSKENIDTLPGQDKDFGGSFGDSIQKSQNVFDGDLLGSGGLSVDTDSSIDDEYEQTVFSDLENFFKTNNEDGGLPDEITADSIPLSEDMTDELNDVMQPADNAVTDAHQGNGKFSLKDEYDSSELIDSILDLLKSREQTIDELNKFGLVSAPETEHTEDEQQIPGSVIGENIQTEDTVPQYESTHVDSELPDEVAAEEQEKDLYGELNKRLNELEELKAEKDTLEEELKQSFVTPEMTVFEKLVEEKPEVTEKISIPEIVIHDKGIPEIDKPPKSLNEALDSLKLDGIIEHLEGTPLKEEKSYDDVFKPADRPFVPVSNTLPPVKKKRIALKFIVYFLLIVLFSAMSFFLYKSILTPSKPKTFDTLETKANDSIIASLNLVDTSLSRGSIILSEFEVERDGDIIYRQTDNGYMIQVAVFDKYNDALKYISGLENKNIHAEIERVDLPLNVTEYRIVIGPFEKLQDAKAYFRSSGVILNFIKVLTPVKTGLSF